MPSFDVANAQESLSLSVGEAHFQTTVQRLEALDAISTVILHHPQQAVLIHELIQVIQRILVVDNVAILLPTSDGKNLIIHTAFGPEEQVADQVQVPIGQGIAGTIMATGEMLIVDDLAQSSAVNPFLREQMCSLLGVPLRIEARIIGVLHVSTIQSRRFSATDSQLLELIADRIAMALEQARANEEVALAYHQVAERTSQLEAIFEAMTDGMVVYDPDGRVTKLNRAARPIFFDSQDWASLSLIERAPRYTPMDENGQVLPPDAWPITRILHGTAIPQEAPIEIIMQFAPDRRMQLSCTGAPLRDASGAITGGVLIWRDVTERRRIERRTRASLQALVEMAQLVISFDNDEATEENNLHLFEQLVELIHHLTDSFCVSVTSVDAATQQLHLLVTYGMPPMARDYWHEHREGIELVAHFGAQFAEQLRANTPVILDMRQPPYHNRPNPYGAKQFLVLPLMSSGRLHGLLSLANNEGGNDYTDLDVQLGSAIGHLLSLALERKRLYLQSRQAEIALREAQAENQRVQEATRLKSEFLANMSHELRTPLNGIIGFTELLTDETFGVTDPEHAEYLGDILTSARHLLRLINDILDLAKIEAGKTLFSPEVGDMAVVLNDVQTTLQPLINQKRLRFEVILDAAVADIYLDIAKLKQIFINFLSNAIKFTPEEGTVTVRVIPDGPEAFIAEIADTGIGIAQKDIPHLFTAFQQLDSSLTKKHQGTGLGLALTKHLVEAQGGQITVRSVLGQGSIFTFSLPRCMASESTDSPPQPEKNSDVARNHVLVVDDTQEDQQALTRWLRNAGYAVTSASTGSEAISACQQQRFAVLILDMILPDMHGHEVLRTVRSLEGYADVPVIVVTMIPDKSIGLGCPVQDILIKPTQHDQLLDAIRQAGVTAWQAKVMVIDDNPIIRKLLDVALSREGFQAICCEDGANGLAMLDQVIPDVIILDLLMPRVNGWEVLTFLRANPLTRTIPVIIWSSADLSQADHARLRQDAQSVALKGAVEASDVIHLIQQYLSEPSTRS